MEVLKDTKGIDIKPPASLYSEGMVKTWYVKKKKKPTHTQLYIKIHLKESTGTVKCIVWSSHSAYVPSQLWRYPRPQWLLFSIPLILYCRRTHDAKSLSKYRAFNTFFFFSILRVSTKKVFFSFFQRSECLFW